MIDTKKTSLSQIMPLGNIILDLHVTSKKRAFEQAGLLFENHHGIARSTVFESLFSRERLGSTALGCGVALPHGRIKDLDNAIVAFIRLEKPVNFKAPDGKLVTLLLCLLIPEKATQKHLNILAHLSKILSDEMVCEILKTENNHDKIYRALVTR